MVYHFSVMELFELIAPCHFGLESVLKKEIYDLGYDIVSVEDGRVTFAGDAEAVARANICLRSAERVLLKAGAFFATSFEELYRGTKEIAWERYFPRDAKFFVTKASSVRSALFSPSDIQSVMKKAMVDRMSGHYHIAHFEESGISCPVRVFIKNDLVTCGIDTTGPSLHKRGYRKMEVSAPIAENLAAALLLLTPWKPGRILLDPFCGSGTFLIEAAMIEANIAPGMKRRFTADTWTHLISPRIWKDARDEAHDSIAKDVSSDLQGYDIDETVLSAARHCAREAGVEGRIHFQTRDVSGLSHRKPYGFIITNPPYGERIGNDNTLFDLYRTLGERFLMLDNWSLYVITSYADAEKAIGKKAAKNRKLYNGMIKTYFYQFPGKKPPGKEPL